MIKRLRIKFIVIAMSSLLAVLMLIIGTVNVLNYTEIVNTADETLYLLQINDGKFPIREDKPFAQQPMQENNFANDNSKPISPELPYESRFFSVVISSEGNVIHNDVENIAAIDDETAKELAEEVIERGNEKGFEGNYRYVVSDKDEGKQVIFLDCSRNLETFRNFRTVSISISVAGFFTVFVLLALLSARIVKPISESYEKQKTFITDAGHEIKTPLAIIEADAEVLQQDMEENQWICDIKKQTKRLADLTNDLIYLSKMDEEQIRTKPVEFPVSDIVEETAQSFQSLAQTKAKNLIIDVQPMISMKGDEKGIIKVVSILLDNALKYSSEKSTVKLTLRSFGKNINITVVNQVKEVTDADPQRFFERFYRADKSRSSDEGGFGIGLSIAKAIVSAHKGKITAFYSEASTLTVVVAIPK